MLSLMAARAQERSVLVPWESIAATSPSKSAQKKTNANVNRTSSSTLELDKEGVSFSMVWKDTRHANERSLRLLNVKYGPLSATEQQKISKNTLPKSLKYSIASANARDEVYTTLLVTPIISENGVAKKVLSFDIDYDYKAPQRSAKLPITNSVLASGEWFKFEVEQTGVHRLDRRFLEELGMNLNGVDPRRLQVYGMGGKSLPLVNSENTIFDLQQTAIQVVGEEDGSFDSGDFILFYGESSLGYVEENDSNINPYSDDSFYYVTIGSSNGIRVQPMIEPSGNPTLSITTFDDYQFFEEDDFSPAKVGRRWFGNRFDIENEQSFEFNFPNIVSGTPMAVRVKVAAASEVSTSMALSINGVALNPLQFAAISDPTLLSTRAFDNSEVGGVEILASGETITFDLAYNNSGNPASIGYLDYISVEAQRQLVGSGEQFAFRNNQTATTSGVGEYQLSNAGAYSQIWDVTNPAAISSLSTESAGSISFKAALGDVREYVAVSPNDFFTPAKIAQSRVPNQDLKGTVFRTNGSFQDIDYLIITPSFLLQPALRLANHRRNVSGLNIKVITTESIYEEFSAGKQDIAAIRNFVRYVYDNASSPANRVKYLCMFGDTSVDYKNRLSENNNIVPTFHTLHSRSTFRSYMTDDFFGSMDPNEGLFLFSDSPEKLDIAVGRILADNVAQANAMVRKIEVYESKESFGNWRNNIVLFSDDVDEFWEYRAIQVSLDSIGDRIAEEKPFINVKKIHSDAFEQTSSAGGNRYPEVNEAIIDAMDVGAIVVNFFGHGGEDGLADEFIVTQEEVRNLDNERLTCYVTVTCEFTKFDNPQRITGGELMFWNERGGAVNMITTTRSIGVSLGVRFNENLASELFGFGLNVPNPPAEAVRRSKILESSANRRVIFYIGDPSLRLAFPRPNIRLTTLNGVPIEQATDTLKALSKVRIGGEVTDVAGNLLSDYNGILETKLFDKNVLRSTLGNDRVRDNNQDVDQDGDFNNILLLDFIALGEGLFNGKATVSNGTFEFEFVVPRDIQIPVGNARVNFYSKRNGVLEDQNGFNKDLIVGGLNENAPEDTQGPDIRLFLNDESFVSGGITNDSPILIANLADENGINTASGIGHDLIAILDGDEANPFILNEYYQANVDDFTTGKATFSLRDIEEGLHTLTVRAWDVYNNSSTAEIQFLVAGDDELEITRVLNYPNPFVNYTEFWFNHNRPFEPLEVQVQVFTVSGKVVWTRNQIVNTDGFLSRDIVWDGLDDFGDKIGKGTYVYKLTVKSTLTNKRVEKFEKLVIL